MSLKELAKIDEIIQNLPKGKLKNMFIYSYLK